MFNSSKEVTEHLFYAIHNHIQPYVKECAPIVVYYAINAYHNVDYS